MTMSVSMACEDEAQSFFFSLHPSQPLRRFKGEAQTLLALNLGFASLNCCVTLHS